MLSLLRGWEGPWSAFDASASVGGIGILYIARQRVRCNGRRESKRILKRRVQGRHMRSILSS